MKQLTARSRARSTLPPPLPPPRRVSDFVASRVSAIALTIGILSLGLTGQAAQGISQVLPPLAQAPAPPPRPEADLSPAAELPAPSVLWLIAMPAVPILGGAGIYLSRRYFGGKSGECRLVAHVAPPEPPPAEDAPPDRE